MELFVQRAVRTIYERYDEPLCLDELARTAMMSKFHFVRMFRRVTGVTPGRFLSAVRLQESKRLLLSTSLNVADVSVRVGYNSTGTFTRRFTELVGFSPTQYRQVMRGGAMPMAADFGMNETSEATGPASGGSVAGRANATETPLSPIYLGTFDSPIPQGWPVACTALAGPGPFRITDVPPGTWYIHAVALGGHDTTTPRTGPPMLGGTVGPVRVVSGAHLHIDLAVRPLGWLHPPVLFALPGLEPMPTAA